MRTSRASGGDWSYFGRSHVNDTFPARGAVEWQWTLGKIATAVVAAGMELLSLGEYPEPSRGLAHGGLGRCRCYEGERRAWEQKQAQAELRAMIDRARHDRGAAWRLLKILTVGSRTFAGFYLERQFLMTSVGIPDALLPDHRELGRADLRF